MKLAIHFGAGNIGRGFIAPTLQANGYKVTFVDINTDLIKKINEERRYTVTSLSIDGSTKEIVQEIDAINLADIENLNDALINADLVTTSVGPKFVSEVYEKIAILDNQKDQIFVAFENMYKASSQASSNTESLNRSLKIIDAVVDKIVPPQPLTSLDVIVETYGSIILDNATGLHPLETSEIINYKNYDNEFYKKLWLLNGLHLQLAYYGLANKYTFIHEIIAHTGGREFAEEAVTSLAEAYSLFSNSSENLDKLTNEKNIIVSDVNNIILILFSFLISIYNAKIKAGMQYIIIFLLKPKLVSLLYIICKRLIIIENGIKILRTSKKL